MPDIQTPPVVRSSRLPFYSRYTGTLHLRAELLNNVFAAVINLATTVARKSLGASDTWVTIMTTAGPAANLTAIFWSNAMEGRPKKPFIMASAIIGRLSLLAMAVATHAPVFVALCCVYYLSEPMFIPAQNAMLQANYSSSIRGSVFGTITGITKIAFLITALAAGYALDHFSGAHRWLFPAAGLVGAVAYFQYAGIRVRRWEAPVRDRARGVMTALKGFVRILREDREFFLFERNFMIYGMAFMIVQPVNIYLQIDVLRMSYTQVSLCTLVMFHVIVAFASRPAGRLLDRIGAPRLAALSFSALVLYVVALGASSVLHSLPMAYVGYALYGVGMSGVNAAWSLGAMRFAGERDAAAYMGAHVACVGVRGLLGPAIGTGIILAFKSPLLQRADWGMPAVYLLSAVLFAIAALGMARQGKRLSASEDPKLKRV